MLRSIHAIGAYVVILLLVEIAGVSLEPSMFCRACRCSKLTGPLSDDVIHLCQPPAFLPSYRI